MKILLILLLICFISVISVFAQIGSITNNLGTGGSFIVKDGAADYLSVSQTTGNLSLFRNFELGGILNSMPTQGVLTKNGTRFMHNYQGTGTDGENTFVGLEAGNFTMGGGSYYNGSFNTGIGYRTLYSNTTGYANTANGIDALYSNTTGYSNTANGSEALYYNTTGSENTANGLYALYSNTTGRWNTANGAYALDYNTTGEQNSGFGYLALFYNIASYNSAFGSRSLENNTLGQANTAFGIGSLQFNTTGNNNTAIGNVAGNNISTGDNNIAVGFNAQVPNGASSNQVRIGNTSISYAGIQVAWSITSDRRWKENIQPTNLGLDFISKLNPVSYTRKNDEEHKSEYGLIAQELEEVLKAQGVENTGMLTVTNAGYYELRYSDLFAPIIKAIQELKSENDQLRSEVESLKSVKEQIAEIKTLKEELQKQIKIFKASNISEGTKFSFINNERIEK